MDNQEFEIKLGKLMKQDFSVGTESFREDLLARCLSVLNEDEGVELSDDDLDMLAAAGELFVDKGPLL